jgi:hypothetical protein
MSTNLAKQWFPQFLTALDRAPMAGLLCATAILFGVILACTRSAVLPGGAKGALEANMLNQTFVSGEKSSVSERSAGLHEGGEILNQAGYFRAAGVRVTFVSADNKRSFTTLENRNLERIARTIAENGKQLEWIVSGTISEYRGTDFLLISRAELKSGASSPETAR